MVVHYTNAIFYIIPFIRAWGLPPPVERCMPALVVYMYPAMFGIAEGAPTPGCMPTLVTLLYPGMFAVVEATPTPVPVSNPYGELGSKRGRPQSSTNKATARKPGPNARILAAKKATSASRTITSMLNVVLLRLARRAAARYRRVPMDQSHGCKVAHKAAAAAAAAVEQDIMRVVRAAAVDPRGLTAGSDPTHRDVLKIIKLFARSANMKRHFFVRNCKVLHIASCSCFWVLQTGSCCSR